ncbi:MAG TPA: 5-oxoprolinase subunit PxpB [Puia sp.]
MNSYSIFPLGDSAITISLGNCIDEEFNIKTLAIHDWLQARPFPGQLDVISAYSTVTVFYDPARAFLAGVGGPEGVYPWLEGLLRRAWEEAIPQAVDAGAGKLIELPVCYEGEYAPDLPQVAAQKGLSPEEVVRLHTAEAYRVYMIGFLPGFPYLGRLDDRLGVPRKPQPEPVRKGGVGIAGMQTGIYPLNSPGGWWIIGRTPAKLFDLDAEPPVLLQAGDRVRFRPITTAEYKHLSIC